MADTGTERVVIVAVDDTEASEKALEWTLDNLYREGDDLRLLHVVPVAAPAGIPLVLDMAIPVMPMESDPEEELRHVARAKEFIQRRFGTKLAAKKISYKVMLIHFLNDNDSIGEAICKRAETLNASAVVMAKHQRGAISTFFLGSATTYCIKNCKAPLIVLHV